MRGFESYNRSYQLCLPDKEINRLMWCFEALGIKVTVYEERHGEDLKKKKTGEVGKLILNI